MENFNEKSVGKKIRLVHGDKDRENNDSLPKYKDYARWPLGDIPVGSTGTIKEFKSWMLQIIWDDESLPLPKPNQVYGFFIDGEMVKDGYFEIIPEEEIIPVVEKPIVEKKKRLYHYKEEMKTEEGKTRRTGGVTHVSLKAMKHLAKIGNPTLVRGYVYKGRYGVNHIGVLVKGDAGSVRFGGFNWGYHGESCRGLRVLFDVLGIDKDVVTLGLSPDFSDSNVGIHWEIPLTTLGIFHNSLKKKIGK